MEMLRFDRCQAGSIFQDFSQIAGLIAIFLNLPMFRNFQELDEANIRLIGQIPNYAGEKVMFGH